MIVQIVDHIQTILIIIDRVGMERRANRRRKDCFVCQDDCENKGNWAEIHG